MTVPAYHRKQHHSVEDPLELIQYVTAYISCTYISQEFATLSINSKTPEGKCSAIISIIVMSLAKVYKF